MEHFEKIYMQIALARYSFIWLDLIWAYIKASKRTKNPIEVIFSLLLF